LLFTGSIENGAASAPFFVFGDHAKKVFGIDALAVSLILTG
jgi:hypothetical protein